MAAEAATDIARGVFTDARWARHVTGLRERWHAADQAHREVETLEVYSTHWIADEPFDTVLWPRHTNRMDARELAERVLDADQKLRDATVAGRAYGMQLARQMAKTIAEVYQHSSRTEPRPSKTRIAIVVVAHLTSRCRADDSAVQLFPPNLRPAGGAR